MLPFIHVLVDTCLFFLSNLIPAFATDEFSVTQNVDYTVNQSGDGEVAQRIDITNNFFSVCSQRIPLFPHRRQTS